EACQRGLAHTRRPPEDHRVRPSGLERHTKRLARTEQMGLPDDFIEVARAQSLGQRRVAPALLVRGKEVSHEPALPLPTDTLCPCARPCRAYSILTTSTPAGATKVNWLEGMLGFGTMVV